MTNSKGDETPEEEELMSDKVQVRPDLQMIPLLANESLYIGVDIGKFKHIAGFVSTTLLARYQRFEGCPAQVAGAVARRLSRVR
jgi:hypothetical protein